MTKRMCAVVCAACWLCPAGPLHAEDARPGGRSWDFSVFLDDKRIGEHRFRLEERDGERVLTSTARFKARFLLVYPYSYAHDNVERWADGCLSSMTAHTDDNGAANRVEATRTNGGLAIEAGGRVEQAAGCVMSFAYWNPAMLQQPRLLNAQTGKYEAVTVTPQGTERITVRGASVEARRYALRSADLAIDLWYSMDDHWLALEAATKLGKRLIYKLN